MRKKSESVRQPLGLPAVSGVVVETLEGRRLLASSAGKGLTPGVTYRPISDRTPTAAADAAAPVAKAAGKATRAYTNYLQLLPKGVATPSAVGASGPVGLTAAQVRQSYGLDSVLFNGITGDGTGQTIAIVDAYDHPGFVSSTDANYVNSDLHQFSVAMGLPDPPSFTKIDQAGGTNYPVANAAWAAEIALDVEWAHAMAPKANIVLVEANSNSFGDLVLAATNTARNIPGVSVVSMSFGFDGGFAGESFFDPYFTTPAGHAGVTFVAASGDHGAQVPAGGTSGAAAYPAESPNVVAVGGTNLAQVNGAYSSETGWSGSGGGISNFEAKPGYQSAVTQSAAFRTTPDVSILGDPATGVAVYDSYNNNDPAGGKWNNFVVGGTSLSAPLYCGVVAVANQGRSVIGLPSLNGATQTLQRLYQLPAATLHDITAGNNGYAAGAGYDLVTGRGTPVGQGTLTGLAGGTYTGFVYADKDGSSTYNAAIDSPLGGITVWNDVNGNTSLDGNETSAVTDATGHYTLDLTAGITLSVKGFQSANGYFRTTGSSAATGTTAYGVFTVGGSIGYFPTTYNLTAGQPNGITFRLDSAGTKFQVFQNVPTTGTATYSISKTLIATQTFIVNGGDGDDTLSLDLTNGTPLTGTAYAFNGGTQTSGDVLNVIAAAAGSAVTFTATGATVATRTLTVSGVEVRNFVGKTGNDAVTMSALTSGTTPTFAGGGGADSITVAGGVYQPAADLGADGTAVSVSVTTAGAAVFNASQHLASLTLTQGTAALAPVGLFLRTSALSIDTSQAATLDLTNGGLIVDYSAASPASAVAAWVAAGYAAGAWTGPGIRSSTAAADAARQHVVGYGEAATAFNLVGAANAPFFGQSVDATTIVARYTIGGDANLNGVANFNDFLALQTNYGAAGKTFADGDFDFDGDVDFSDFLSLQTTYGLLA